jgi:hypothetical protein
VTAGAKPGYRTLFPRRDSSSSRASRASSGLFPRAWTTPARSRLGASILRRGVRLTRTVDVCASSWIRVHVGDGAGVERRPGSAGCCRCDGYDLSSCFGSADGLGIRCGNTTGRLGSLGRNSLRDRMSGWVCRQAAHLEVRNSPLALRRRWGTDLSRVQGKHDSVRDMTGGIEIRSRLGMRKPVELSE